VHKFAGRSAFAVALFAVGLAVTTPARADVEVGILSCRSLGATSYIIVSDQARARAREKSLKNLASGSGW